MQYVINLPMFSTSSYYYYQTKFEQNVTYGGQVTDISRNHY